LPGSSTIAFTRRKPGSRPNGIAAGPSTGSLDTVIWFIAPLHVVSALLLVFLVLLHSGKGGGLSDMFGGGLGAQAAGSTVVERNLDRITIVAALVFAFASISYALII